MSTTQILERLRGKDLALGILVLVLILFRIWSIFEPHWNTDEGIYAATAFSMKSGMVLYKDIWADQMPGVYLINYLALFAGTYNLAVVKLISLLFSTVSLITIFYLTKQIVSKYAAYLAAVISVFFIGLPVFEANVAHPIIFSMPFVLAGIYFATNEDRPTLNNMVISGSFFATGILFSISTLFPLSAIALSLLVSNRDKLYGKRLLLFLGGVSIPLLFAGIILILNNVIFDWFHMVLYNPLDYFFEEEPGLGLIFLKNTLFIRTIILVCSIFVVLILLKQKIIGHKKLTIIMWGLFVLYGLLFPLQRPSYLFLEVIPFFALLSGFLITRLPLLSATKNIEICALYFLGIFFSINLFTTGQPISQPFSTTDYYLNHYKYVTRKIETPSYTTFFGQDVYDMYSLNSYLTQNQKEDVYIFTSNPWIYQIGNIKPISGYLSSANTETKEIEKTIQLDQPRLVILDSNTAKEKLQELRASLLENGYQFDRYFEDYELYTLAPSVSL